MIFTFYNRYFAKDKPLRHYTQHLLISFLGFFMLPLLKVELSLSNFWNFLFYSYIIDLDGLISVFIFKDRIKEAGEIFSALKSMKFMESATLGTIHHKKLNRLLIHNVIGLVILIFIFINSVIQGDQNIILISFAILTHFIFDIFDDFYQLGHVKNWLWPVSYFSKPG